MMIALVGGTVVGLNVWAVVAHRSIHYKGLAMGIWIGFGVAVLLEGDPRQETGYHYYPSIQQVKEWTRQARLSIVDEGEGDDYYHFIAQKEKES